MTLFASAFPLAAAVSILFLFIEGRADLFKLLYMYQRPKVRRYIITLLKNYDQSIFGMIEKDRKQWNHNLKTLFYSALPFNLEGESVN